MKIFDYCISNPPYQKDVHKETSTRRVSIDIYPNFQQLGIQLSKNSSMIYPATWQKTIQTGLGKQLINNGLYNCVELGSDNVFPNSIRWNYPLSIVHLIKNYQNDFKVNNIVISRKTPVWISSQYKANLMKQTKDYKKLSDGAKFSTKLSNIKDTPNVSFDNEYSSENPVKIYIKKNPGKQPDGKDYYISTEDAKKIVLNSDYLKLYKVCIRSRVIGRLPVFNDVQRTVGNLQAKVYEPNYISGMTWAILKTFNNLIEAENFAKYVNTKFFMDLSSLDISMKSFASYCPDLEDYGNNNILFQNNPTVEELNSLLMNYFKIDN